MAKALRGLFALLQQSLAILRELAEVRKRPFEQLRQLAEILRESFEQLRQLAEILRELAEDRKRLTEVLKRLTEVLRQLAERLKRLAEDLRGRSPRVRGVAAGTRVSGFRTRWAGEGHGLLAFVPGVEQMVVEEFAAVVAVESQQGEGQLHLDRARAASTPSAPLFRPARTAIHWRARSVPVRLQMKSRQFRQVKQWRDGSQNR